MILDITPVPKPRMTKSDRWKKRPAVTRYWAFCDQLREQWGDEPLPEAVSMFFQLPMPNSWSKKKKAELAGKPHKQRPDIDNLMKAVMDALCEDDSYIHSVKARKEWSKIGAIVLTEAI